MRKILIVLALLCAIPAGAQVNGQTTLTVTGAGWNLVFADEFAGPVGGDPTGIDLTKWEFRENNSNANGQNPPPQQSAFLTQRTQNCTVPTTGGLHLIALHDNYQGHPYTTCQIDTEGLYSIPFDTNPQGVAIEVSAQLPDGNGVWPAIWEMPVDPTAYGSWPMSGELDEMEMPASDPTVYGSIHYDTTSQDTAYTLPSGLFSGGFHVFRVEVYATGMNFFVDGKLSASYNNYFTGSNPLPAPFNKPFYLILSQQLGSASGWSGAPDASTPFPSVMVVRYVHIYTHS